MKDAQVDQSGQFARIPFLSTALHCGAMTVLVFLRSSFGYLYLRPRSLLFGAGWTVILFTIYAANTPSVWRQYGAVCLFGVVATLFYASHLAFSMWQQTRDQGEHDQYSGTSHLSRLLKKGGSETSKFEFHLHLWGEALLVVIVATMLRTAGVSRLPTWLAFAAFCLFGAELTNYWLTIRRKKRQADMFADAEEVSEPAGGGMDIPPPKATRRPPRKRSGSGG